MTSPGGTGRSSDRLAERLAGAFADVPDQVMAAARLHLLDALGVGMAAAACGPVRGVTALASSAGGGPCTVLGRTGGTSASIAALVNGALIHSLEYDDTHVASVMHGSAVLAPAALAAAEQVGASGRDLLAAYAVGWELLIRIGLASPGRIQAKGFQITSAAGAFAAAAVSCLLHGDSPRVTTDAIGIAGSQAGGTFAFLAGGDTVKAVQPGWAAHAGMLAGELARAGVTGPERVFEGRFGFFSLYADDPDAGERLLASLDDVGSTWHLTEAAFKLVPCCHYIHPFVEAVTSLMADGLASDDLASLHCYVPAEVVPVIAEPWAERQSPVKAHDARWSLPYVLALVLAHGRVTAADFEGAVDPECVRLAGRMTFEAWPHSGFPERFAARIRVGRRDGTAVDVAIDDVRGGRGRPVDPVDVLEKARQNLGLGGLTADEVETVVGQLSGAGPDLGVIGTVLRTGR